MATLPFDATASRHRLTVADYRRMEETGILRPDDRVELIAGEIIDMSPIGSLHAAVVDLLASLFHQHCGPRAIVRVQSPILLDEASAPQPDLAILRPRADFYRDALPGPADVLLLVEVADSSLPFDLAAKVPLYAAAEIAETWVIDAATLTTHRFRQPAGGRYTSEALIAATESLVCEPAGGTMLAGLSITLGMLLPPPRPGHAREGSVG
jgi:Uma2 family endonuclease